MTAIPLRRELLISFAILFAAALVVAVNAVLFILPALASPTQVMLFVTLLLVADLIVLFAFGSWLLRARLVLPLERLTATVGRVAEGRYDERASGASTMELMALERGVNAMADRVLADQKRLAENIDSLEQTNAELVEARGQVVQSAQLASVGTLAAGIAHEVGNPLGAIMAYLDVARARASRPEGNLEVLEAIRTESRRIDRIVRSLLDYARPKTDEASAVAPAGVVLRVRDLLEAQGKLDSVEHEWHIADRAPDVLMVAHRLEQVLVNLLLNALDALEGHPHPRIVVTLSGDAGQIARLPSRRQGDPMGVNYMHRRRVSRDLGVDPLFTAAQVAVITVSDNGPGIPEADFEKVFDPFFTTKEPGKGTGLGLSICARLIDGMGGRIEAGRGPEGGARFTIRLPSAGSEVAHPPGPGAETSRAGAKS